MMFATQVEWPGALVVIAFFAMIAVMCWSASR